MDKVAATILILISIIILARIIQWILGYLSLRKKLSSIPGPNSIPFIGLAWQLRNIPTEDIYEFLMKLGFQYKNGMYVTWLGTHPLVNLRKPHQLEVILKSRTLITKGQFYHYISYWLKNGLLTSTGDDWHYNRRLITPSFHFNILDEFTDVIVEKVIELNDYLNKQVGKDSGKMFNIFPIIIRFTLETTLKTVMGLDIGTHDRQSEKKDYVSALHTFTDLSIYRYSFLPYRFDFIFYRTKKGREYLKALKTLHTFTTEVINEKKKEREKKTKLFEDKIENDYDTGVKKKTKAFLDLMMDASEAEEHPLSVEELRQQVDTFMFAAHDTTGTALSWTLFCLGNSPDVQKNVQEEIDEIIGDSDEPLTKENLARLKLLERVIKEALRIFSSAPKIERVLDHDIVIDDHNIPKGTTVAMQLLHMHRDPEVWKDPLKFDPDRFLPENSHGRHPYAYVPFSAGPRNCVGQKFGMLVLKVALIGILKKWTVSSKDKIKDVKLVSLVVLTPADGTINLHFTRRSDNK